MPQTSDVMPARIGAELDIISAVNLGIRTEGSMLNRGWQIFDRDRAQLYDGLEVVARQLDIIRFLPSLPFSRRKKFTPMSRPAYR